MEYFTFEKKDVKEFFKKIFSFHKKEVIFLIVMMALILAFIISSSIWDFMSFRSTEAIPKIVTSLIELIVVILPLLIYKWSTKCDEFEFFKIAFLLSILWSVVGILQYCFYLLKFADQKVPAFMVTLFHSLHSTFGTITLFIGITWLLYHKIDFKELLFVLAGVVVIYIIPSANSWIIYGTKVLSPTYFRGLLNANSIMLAITSGVCLYYCYKQLQEYLIIPYKEIIFFLTVGIITILLSDISQITHLITQVVLDSLDIPWTLTWKNILLPNLDTIIYYLLMALVAYLCNKLIHKRIKKNHTNTHKHIKGALIVLAISLVAIIAVLLVLKSNYTNHDPRVNIQIAPTAKLNDTELQFAIATIKFRLNYMGYPSEITVNDQNQIILSVSRNLINQSGIFSDHNDSILSESLKSNILEAKINDQVVFTNKEIIYTNDILKVCNSGDCSKIDYCFGSGTEYYCQFLFEITLSQQAADRQANITKDLDIQVQDGVGYLSQDLYLYLNGVEVDRLKIGESLKGKAETKISLSGSGSGVSKKDAYTATESNMWMLQALVISEPLASDFKIVKIENETKN